jgi:transposase
MDVHRSFAQIAVVEDGICRDEGRIGVRPEELRAWAAGLRPDDEIALEATTNSDAIATMLRPLVRRVVVSNPRKTRAIAEAKVKTDKVDARILAQLLRTDFLPEAWIAPKEIRDLRSLLRHRASLVRVRTSLKNRIHAVLADEGLKADGETLWSDKGQAWLATVSLRPMHRSVVDDCCGLLDAVAIPIARLEADTHRLAKDDPRVDALCQLRGVGVLTAMTLVSEIGDISRFATARKLCAWAGLIPTVRNSDTKVRHGHITKAGPAAVRWILAEASYQARLFPPFAQPFESIAKRRGRRIANVAISRKLLCRCFHILKAVEAAR